jgi:hypothetical protein
MAAMLYAGAMPLRMALLLLLLLLPCIQAYKPLQHNKEGRPTL